MNKSVIENLYNEVLERHCAVIQRALLNADLKQKVARTLSDLASDVVRNLRK